MNIETEDYSSEGEELSQSQSIYSPDSEEAVSSSTSSPSASQGDPLKAHLQAPKAIVFISSLLQLFSTCQVYGCQSAVDPANIEVRDIGAVIVIKYTCNENHSGEWCSSPFIGEGKNRVGVLNVLLATYSLTCGLHISQVLDYFSHMKIHMFGQTFFYKLKSDTLDKVVWLTWSDCQKTEIQNLKTRKEEGTAIKLAGDGKFDSRGFTAAYCTYVLLDLHSSKVVALWVAQNNMVKSSSDMEQYAAKTILLSMAWDHEVAVDSITTDRSTSMRKMLEEIHSELPPEYTPPTHQFDIWHWIKAVLKELWVAAKLVSCKGLKEWIPSITNMMWFSFSSCQGDPELLREKLLSIPEHISNQHNFSQNKKYTACPHPPLIGDRAKAWLPAGSLAVKKVRAALRGKADGRINDVPFMVSFTHTGLIENWNSLHGKYAGKDDYYGHSGMLVRAALAAIDHNCNTQRMQAKTIDGVLRYDLVKNRIGNKWFVKKVKEGKNQSWRDEIAFLVLKLSYLGKLLKIDLPIRTEDSIVRSAIPRPSKEDAIKHHQSRMAKS